MLPETEPQDISRQATMPLAGLLLAREQVFNTAHPQLALLPLDPNHKVTHEQGLQDQRLPTPLLYHLMRGDMNKLIRLQAV